MEKPKIFIACSGRAKFLAEELQSELRISTKFSDVTLWSEDSRKNPGTTISDRLRERADESDFAAVFLTEDDVTLKKGTEYRTPRDNCIFEAGLFAGALGVDFKRCFLICSVQDPKALPSDLQELQHIPFTQPANLEKLQDLLARDPQGLEPEDQQRLDEFRQALNTVVALILSKAKRPLDRPVVPLVTVTKNRLMELEQLGENLKKGAVVVNATQPLEEDYSFALRVMQNMKNDVDYIYFFHANPRGTGANFILKMIQMISLAGLSEEGRGDRSSSDLETIMRARTPDVIANLAFLRARLSIHFLPHEAPVEFCVHNADSNQHAKCYLRYSKNCFVQWYKDAPDRAMAVAEDLRSQCILDHKEVIFRSTQNFDLTAPENLQFKNSLYRGIERYFLKDLHQAVGEACFGDGSYKIAQLVS